MQEVTNGQSREESIRLNFGGPEEVVSTSTENSREFDDTNDLNFGTPGRFENIPNVLEGDIEIGEEFEKSWNITRKGIIGDKYLWKANPWPYSLFGLTANVPYSIGRSTFSVAAILELHIYQGKHIEP